MDLSLSHSVTGTLPQEPKALLFQFEQLFFQGDEPKAHPDIQLLALLQSLRNEGIFFGITSLLSCQVVRAYLEKLGVSKMFSHPDYSLLVAQEQLLRKESIELNLLTRGYLVLLDSTPYNYQDVIFIGSERTPLERLYEYYSWELCTILVNKDDPVGALSELIFKRFVPSCGALPESLQ